MGKFRKFKEIDNNDMLGSVKLPEQGERIQIQGGKPRKNSVFSSGVDL